jgi:hypothetical protein
MGERLSWCSWRLIDLGGWEFRKSNDAWSAQSLTNQATTAHHVPDQEHAEGRNRHQTCPEQDCHSAADSWPRFWTLIKHSPQPASRRPGLDGVSVARAIAIAVNHRGRTPWR